MALDDLIVTMATVLIAAFIFARVSRISLFAYRSGKRTAAMLFAAYDCALLASLLAVIGDIHAGHVGKTDSFEWLAGLCLMYGCFKLWLYLHDDSPLFGSIPHAAQSSNRGQEYRADAITKALGGEVTGEATDLIYHPAYHCRPDNIHHMAGDR